MTNEPIVHIVDDDASMRDALHRLFKSSNIDSRKYGTTQEFLETDLRYGAGCLVLDVRLPGVNGLEFQKHLSDAGVRMPVIMITGYGDIPMSVQAMKAGAVDFLTKPFRDQDMLDAVLAAINRDKAARVQSSEAEDVKALFKALSPREQQVMALVTAGKLNKQVAGELELSEITVKIHRAAGMKKMGAKTFADFVRMADLLGLNTKSQA